jgi:hypothetical protein
MAIVGGLDIHRRQITYDWVDTDTGQARHGRIQPATRVELRAWLARLAGQQADFAFEGTTGWRYVAEEVMGAGFRAHLAEPADTRALRGPKRRAKTDRADAHHLRDLLLRGVLPESWIPPAHVADVRAQVRLRKRSWTSAPPGINASTPCCTTTACRNAPGCSPIRAAPG